jgi:uncharacterized protein (TIGR04255 family)
VFDGNPLVNQPPKEIPLKDPPLIRVIAQVRFPDILSIEQPSFIAKFQEDIREKYPTLRPEQSTGFSIGPQGIGLAQPSTIWCFIDVTGNWRVSLSINFITLETTNYISRTDFLDRLMYLLNAANINLKPRMYDRFGLRYIARLEGNDREILQSLVRPEVSGILPLKIDEHTEQNISYSLFKVPNENAQIHAKWGLLPANLTIDPSAIEAISQPSWIIDLDMVSIPFSEIQEFNTDVVTKIAKKYAERLYTLFRWAVTKEFLIHFGGEI